MCEGGGGRGGGRPGDVAVLSPQEGETVGSSSVYTKAISTALELFARSDNGKLDTGKNADGSYIFQ